jgi:hypothetical protein
VLLEYFTSPYRDGATVCQNWELVLLGQRTVLALLSILIPDIILRFMILVLWCIVMLTTHVLAHPFADMHDHRMQTVFLCCLLLICALEFPKAAVESMGAPIQSPIEHQLHMLESALSVVFLLPLLLVLLYLVHEKRRTARRAARDLIDGAGQKMNEWRSQFWSTNSAEEDDCGSLNDELLTEAEENFLPLSEDITAADASPKKQDMTSPASDDHTTHPRPGHATNPSAIRRASQLDIPGDEEGGL